MLKKMISQLAGKALTGPIRKCSITGARLPAHFLQRFRAVYSPSPTQPEFFKPKVVPYSAPASTMSDSSKGSTFSAASSYVLNSQTLIEHIHNKKQWKVVAIERMRAEWDGLVKEGRGKGDARDPKLWGCDENASNNILESLRRKALSALKEHVESNGSTYFVAMAASADRVAAEHGAESTHRNDQPTTTTGDQDSPMIGFNAVVTVIYDFGQLFTDDQTSTMPSSVWNPQQVGTRITIAQHESTLRLHGALLKLGAYLNLASHTPLDSRV